MPFPVEEKYIIETEESLGVKFPEKFIKKILINNGGEVIIKNTRYNNYPFILFPFYDKSSRKRIKRTCNHLGLENNNLRKQQRFPDKAIVIGKDDYGNYLILLEITEGILGDALYFWDHETNEVEKITNNIENLKNKK